jgi:hypothetical protein
LGTIASLTATQIVLDENIQAAVSDNENLKKHVIPTSESRKRSIWASSSLDGGHDGSFTIEAIITPYDVNGHGSRASGVHGVLDSTKTPPYPSDDYGNREANYYSVSILKDTNYLTQKMMIFYNEKLKLFLQNTALSSYNQPAEYKIVASIKDGNGTWHPYESDTVITASNSLHSYYDETGYYIQNITNRKRISASATGSAPTGTATISSTSLPSNTAATGQIAFSGVPSHYSSPVNATGSITIANRHGFKTDVTVPVKEVGSVLFSGNPVDSTNTDVNNHILVTHEGGSTTTKWFAIPASGNTNNSALVGDNGNFTWPSNSRGYLIAGSGYADTAQNFADAVNAHDTGFAGTASDVKDANALYVGGATPKEVDLTVAYLDAYPDRKGDDGATLSAGSSLYSHNGDGNSEDGMKIVPFAGGVNELIQGLTTGHTSDDNLNYITIADSAGGTKNYFPSHDSSQATGSTGTRTLDNSSTVSVVYFQFASNGTNADAATALKDAINHANGHGSTITATRSGAVVNLSHDIIGTVGNNATLAKNQIADSVATISGATFTGGANISNNTNTPYIQIENASGTTKYYVPVKNGDEIATGTAQAIGSVSAAVAFQVGADATGSASSLKTAILHANGHNGSITVSNSGATRTLTQTTAGTAGNTDIRLGDTGGTVITNTTATNFANGATPTSYIQITDHSGTVKKYKAATTEGNNTTDGTYVFFRNGSDTTESATNLKNAINHSNGHNGSIIATSSNNVVTYKINNLSLLQGAISLVGISSGVTLSNPTFSTNTKEISVSSGETDGLGKGNNIYSSSNVEIGTVDSISGTTITLLADPLVAVTSTIYTSQSKEAFYLQQPMKISLVYQKHGSIELYLNNNLVKKATHTIGAFTLGQADCRIGRGGDDTSSGDNEQFFGEIFEIAMHKGNRPCATTNTLTPGYSDILFYYTFGDV